MNRPRFISMAGLLLWAMVLALPTGALAARSIDLPRPDERQFVLDRAGMIDPEDEEAIKRIADKLLTDHATPIIVVTIESMAAHGGGGMSIETFARILFDQWQIGHATLGKSKTEWNTGILLLVSKNDRKARIELGAGWGRGNDQTARQIMDDYIIPKFKAGNFADGIEAGVVALDAMARKKPLPTVPRPWWHYALVVGFIGLVIFTVVSLIRRGSSGWAWVFWAVVFSLLGTLLYHMLTRSSSGGGLGFGGGSFGGGFSGGGGATGSW